MSEEKWDELIELQERLGLAQRNLATAFRVSPTTVSNWQNRVCRPNEREFNSSVQNFVACLDVKDSARETKSVLDYLHKRAAWPWASNPSWLPGRDPRKKLGAPIGGYRAPNKTQSPPDLTKPEGRLRYLREFLGLSARAMSRAMDDPTDSELRCHQWEHGALGRAPAEIVDASVRALVSKLEVPASDAELLITFLSDPKGRGFPWKTKPAWREGASPDRSVGRPAGSKNRAPAAPQPDAPTAPVTPIRGVQRNAPRMLLLILDGYKNGLLDREEAADEIGRLWGVEIQHGQAVGDDIRAAKGGDDKGALYAKSKRALTIMELQKSLSGEGTNVQTLHDD